MNEKDIINQTKVDLKFIKWLEEDFISNYYSEALNFYENLYANFKSSIIKDFIEQDKEKNIKAVAMAEASGIYSGIKNLYFDTLFKLQEFREFLPEEINQLLNRNVITIDYKIIEPRNLEVILKIKNKEEFKSYIKMKLGAEEIDDSLLQEVGSKILIEIVEAIVKQEKKFNKWLISHPSLQRKVFEDEIKFNEK